MNFFFLAFSSQILFIVATTASFNSFLSHSLKVFSTIKTALNFDIKSDSVAYIFAGGFLLSIDFKSSQIINTSFSAITVKIRAWSCFVFSTLSRGFEFPENYLRLADRDWSSRIFTFSRIWSLDALEDSFSMNYFDKVLMEVNDQIMGKKLIICEIHNSEQQDQSLNFISGSEIIHKGIYCVKLWTNQLFKNMKDIFRGEMRKKFMCLQNLHEKCISQDS
jgi:hypothetical protein